ncbi:MAG: acyl-CoA thioesterase [Kiritimatiellaeota bacterium]|nr:acyl-CoA thioesterase [Kiritimatiellota bacterium]
MGVVYHANYLVYFERCRNELMRHRGYTYREMEALGLALPVIEAHVQYKSPAKYDDLLDLRGFIAHAQGFRIRIDVHVFRDDELLVTGHTLHCCVNLATLRPVRLPPDLLL